MRDADPRAGTGGFGVVTGSTPMSPRRVAERPRLFSVTTRFVNESQGLIALVIFALVVVVFAMLLCLPIAAADGRATALHDAVFTAVSAVTVTGLVSVDTAQHWSFFGQFVILSGVQIGGLGIVTIALLLTRTVTRQLGVRSRLLAQQGVGTSKLHGRPR